MKKLMAIIVGASLLAGCAKQFTAVPIGGSKADGTVRMGYQYGMFIAPQVNLEQAKRDAGARCKVWGYTGAEPFGGQITTCAQPSSSGCMLTNVAIDYQCTGGKAAQN